MPTNSSIELPEFLRSYSDFLSHLDEHFEVLDNQGRGDIFSNFSLRLLPLIDEWAGFELPTPSEKKTHDGGVDFSAKKDTTSTTLVGQSKYKIRKVDDLDNIISKFAAYEAQQTKSPKGTQGNLPISGFVEAKPNFTYLIVTSSKLEAIRKSTNRPPYRHGVSTTNLLNEPHSKYSTAHAFLNMFKHCIDGAISSLQN